MGNCEGVAVVDYKSGQVSTGGGGGCIGLSSGQVIVCKLNILSEYFRLSKETKEYQEVTPEEISGPLRKKGKMEEEARIATIENRSS